MTVVILLMLTTGVLRITALCVTGTRGIRVSPIVVRTATIRA